MPNTEKPRILIFSLAYTPLVGGAELAVKEITDRLAGDFIFDLITHRFNPAQLSFERIGAVNIYRVGRGSQRANLFKQRLGKILFVARAWHLAKRLHYKNNYSAVWSIMAAYAGLAALLFKFSYPGAPWLLTLQEGDSEKHILSRVGIFYPLWRFIFKKADYIQAISRYLADFARRHGAKCSIKIVPNGVDLQKFKIQNAKFKSTNQNSKVIISTSRLVYKNGIDILIRSIAELKSRLPITNYQLLVLGGGPEEQELEKLAENLGVDEKVVFLGHIEPDDIPGYLARADVFVRPSRSEGLGSSFLEAIAMGLPVIGTPVGGIPDFLKDGETGLFCQVDDPKDLAEKISLLLRNDKLREQLGRNGQKLVWESYSWDNIAAKMTAIFNLLYLKPYTLNPIKILIATGVFPPDIGGPATYAALLVSELPKRGFKVKVLSYGASGVSRNLPKGLRHIVYFFKCWWMAYSADVIFAQDPVSVGLPALAAAKLSGRKFVIRVAGDYAWEQSVQRFGVADTIDDFQKKKYGWRVELLRWVQKMVVAGADAVITPSKYFQILVAGWVKNPEKVKVIYNGISLENPKSKILNSKPYTLKTIISAGRLVPWKGFNFLIELMLDLPGWKLIIVGDGPEKQNLESRIRNLGLDGRVKLTGAISRKELFEYLRSADIFILNTTFESFSFQIIEAMSVGLPVVATNIGNLAEIIDSGKDGILVEPNNKRQFLEAILKIDREKDFREMLSRNAQAKAEQFSIDKTMDQLADLFRHLK